MGRDPVSRISTEMQNERQPKYIRWNTRWAAAADPSQTGSGTGWEQILNPVAISVPAHFLFCSNCCSFPLLFQFLLIFSSVPAHAHVNATLSQIELTLSGNNGRITIDGNMDTFKTQDCKFDGNLTRFNLFISTDSDDLELGGSFYVGGVDYMDPNLSK